MPTEAALRAYYRRYYEHGSGVTLHGPERFADHIARQVPVRPMMRVLDFGGGDGSVSLLIAEHFLAHGTTDAEVLIVDYNACARSPQPEIRVRTADTLERIDRYELVLASAILEHIPHPQPVLQKLLSAVTPGGFFYARTPAMAPLLEAMARLGLHGDFTFPGHLHDMGERYWSGVVDRMGDSGLQLVVSRPSLIETKFGRDPVRTLAAFMVKAPWRALGRRWPYVGGWEVVIRRGAS
ncbi:MAG TPA: methyltransferase domain-containing protein [Bryobacteraceae bacterium]|nr:methyltransferase domain-containing protein [Bryobacteraceae bacterium]